GRTARELAHLTDRFAIDTDDIIESFAKQKIRKIFKNPGEATFRAMEQQTALWLENNVNNTIVSTGGGFFMVEQISKLGRVIYLHSSVEHIIDAIHNHPKGAQKIKKRPLLQDLNKAKELYAHRLPRYREVADYEINVEGAEIGKVAEEIVEMLKI
ncbi:MAG: shikimate kinase, partial [Desulfobulbia bacterium]